MDAILNWCSVSGRFVVPESPRWLLVKGRIDEVRRIIEAAAKFNGRQLPADYQLTPPTQESSSQDFTYLFRSSYLRRISICFLCIWFTMNLVYYGIILNMSSFGGNVYLNSVSLLADWSTLSIRHRRPLRWLGDFIGNHVST